MNPQYREGSKILFLIDYPEIKDAEKGVLLSGLGRRSIYIHKLIKELKVSQDLISIASLCRCITKSKAITNYQDYQLCGSRIIADIPDDIKGIVAFGSMAGRFTIGRRIESIDEARGRVHESIFDKRPAVVTYTLAVLADKGCNACSSNVYPYLVLKDIGVLIKHMKGEGTL